MSNAKRLPEKDPGETVVLCFEFADEFPEHDDSPATVITGFPDLTCVVDSSLFRGADPDAASMLVGSPEVLGTQVLQAATAGLHGVDYKVQCCVEFNSSPTVRICKTSILPVRNQ